MRSRIFRSLALSMVLAIAGCASIIGGGTKQDIKIDSTPTAADYKITTVAGVDVATGKTPTTIKLKRGKEYKVTVSLAGYKEAVVPVEKSLQGWFWGNIICGGVIGIIIDLSNGAAYKLEPDEIKVELMTASNSSGQSELFAVFTALDESGQLRVLPVPMIPNRTGLDP